MAFKNNNARITLGLQILRANQEIMKLLGGGNAGAPQRAIDGAFEKSIRWMDGQLAPFRQYMKLELVDDREAKIITLDYLKARQYISKELSRIQEKNRERTGAEYYSTFFPINLWSQLLASCYDQLQLSPEEAFKETAEEGLSAYGITQPAKED